MEASKNLSLQTMKAKKIRCREIMAALWLTIKVEIGTMSWTVSRQILIRSQRASYPNSIMTIAPSRWQLPKRLAPCAKEFHQQIRSIQLEKNLLQQISSCCITKFMASRMLAKVRTKFKRQTPLPKFLHEWTKMFPLKIWATKILQIQIKFWSQTTARWKVALPRSVRSRTEICDIRWLKRVVWPK